MATNALWELAGLFLINQLRLIWFSKVRNATAILAVRWDETRLMVTMEIDFWEQQFYNRGRLISPFLVWMEDPTRQKLRFQIPQV